MSRRSYVALAWPAASADISAAAARSAARLEADPAWRQAHAAPGLQVWTRRPHALPVRPLPGDLGVVIGDLFPRTDRTPGQLLETCRGLSAAAVAQRLTAAAWGRYVALLQAEDGAPATYRDPSGQLGAVTWTRPPGVIVIAADPTHLPVGFQPRGLGLDWIRIRRFLAAPAAHTTDPLFGALEAVGPGELARLHPGGLRRSPIWRPADFALDPVDARDAAPELVARVDEAVRRLVGLHERVILEVSGGLDSAIVAGSLGVQALTPRVAEWLNRDGPRREAEESAFARAVTDRLGVPLTVVARRPAPLAEADLMALAGAFRPAMAGVDAVRDRDEAERALRSGATAIVSGEGGDAAFFQMPSALVVADAWRREGWRALASPLLADVARRTRQSVWQVLAQAWRGGRTLAWPGLVSRYVRADPDPTAPAAHAWVADAEARDAAPAKRLQIVGLSAAHLFHGESRRGRLADLVHPLFAQPVMELCLAIPAPDLAGGAYDRPYAQAVFAGRIPEAVRRRRAKGNLGAYYAQTVALSLDGLRPFLLDGVLAEAGVLDRARLAAALSPERLIWDEAPTQILWAAVTEAWVRHWQTRMADAACAPRF